MNNTALFYNVTQAYKSPVSISYPISTAVPAIQSGAYLPLTIVLVIFYSLIFLAVYFQLLLILYYKHKRYSYQTALLFLCLVWATLRIILFSFYFNNAKEANQMIFIFYFCLYCFPVVIQFCILCLLVLYYGQVIICFNIKVLIWILVNVFFNNFKLYFKISNRSNLRRNR